MVFEPKQRNRAPEVWALCLFLAATAAYAFSIIEGIMGKGFLQLMAVVMFCAMIFVMVRYKYTSFRYTVCLLPKGGRSRHHEDDEEAVPAGGISYEDAEKLPVGEVPVEMLMLKIERRQGSGAWGTECMIKLSEIERCLYLPEELDEAKTLLRSNRASGKYKYFKNMTAQKQTLILAKTAAGKSLVYLERDGRISPFLKKLNNN